MPERFRRSLGRPLREQSPPLGYLQHSLCEPLSTSRRAFGRRCCLRRGCGRLYHARRWNQRYCREPECLKLVHRWQATKRQQERRKEPEVRQAHAAAERERRARQRAEGSGDPPPHGPDGMPPDTKPEDGRGAWSRSRIFSAPFCDRPGCYDAVRPSCRCPARYCGDPCRQAIHRVRDRERKWLSRNTQMGRFKRYVEYQASRAPRSSRLPSAPRGP